jgi:hypothetical protein
MRKEGSGRWQGRRKSCALGMQARHAGIEVRCAGSEMRRVEMKPRRSGMEVCRGPTLRGNPQSRPGLSGASAPRGARRAIGIALGMTFQFDLGRTEGGDILCRRSPKGGPWDAVEPRNGVCQRAKAIQEAGGCRALAVRTFPNLPHPPKPLPPDSGPLIRENQISYHSAVAAAF